MENVIYYADADTGQYLDKIEGAVVVTSAPADPLTARWNGVTWEYPMRYLADPETGQFLGQDNSSPKDGQVWSDTAPPNPARHHRLIDGAWQFDGDIALAEKRGAAVLGKADFCKALVAAKILTMEDFPIAVQGGWPPSFVAALDGMDEGHRMDAQSDWATATEIPRASPLLLALARFAGLDDAALDALFGI